MVTISVTEAVETASPAMAVPAMKAAAAAVKRMLTDLVFREERK
jgi:hypothetical protein